MISGTIIQEKPSLRKETDNKEKPREIVTPPRTVQVLLKENACTRLLMTEELRSMGFSDSAANRLIAGEECVRQFSRHLEKKVSKEERKE